MTREPRTSSRSRPAPGPSARDLTLLGVAAAQVLVACGGGSQSTASVAGLRTVADLPLPGAASRLDYQSLDAGHHRLYISHLGAGTVIVVDVQSGSVVGEIQGVGGAHGVIAVPERNRVYATATDAHELVTIDPTSLSVTARTAAGAYPDGLAFDPQDDRVFVSDESGGTDNVVDARTNRSLGAIDLGGEVGNTQYDAATHQVVAAAQGRNSLVLIDPVRMTVVRRIPVAGCDEPHGVYLRPDGGLAWVACQGNARLVAVDLRSGTVTTPQPVGDTPDVLALDPGLQRLYVASESGTLSVFDVGGTEPRKVGEGFAGPRAHTVAVDPATHTVYLPLGDVDGRPVLREMALA